MIRLLSQVVLGSRQLLPSAMFLDSASAKFLSVSAHMLLAGEDLTAFLRTAAHLLGTLRPGHVSLLTSLSLACKLHEAEECFWMNNFYKLAEGWFPQWSLFAPHDSPSYWSQLHSRACLNSKFLLFRERSAVDLSSLRVWCKYLWGGKTTQFYGLWLVNKPSGEVTLALSGLRIMDITWTLCPVLFMRLWSVRAHAVSGKEEGRFLLYQDVFTLFPLVLTWVKPTPQRRSRILCVFHIEI